MNDPIQMVYDRIVAILRAEPAFYSASGRSSVSPFNAVPDLVHGNNFVHYGTGAAPKPSKVGNLNDGDFPLAILEEGRSTNEAYKGTVTFGTFAASGPCMFRSRMQTSYTLTIVGRDQRLVVPSALAWAAQTALIKALPSLGSIAKTFGPLAVANRISETIMTPTGPVNTKQSRRQFAIDIPVAFDFDGIALKS